MTIFERITLVALSILAAFIFFLMYLPALVLVLFSFFADEFQRFSWGNFTFEWYRTMFSNQDMMGAMLNSLIVGIFAVTIAICFGLLVGYFFISGRRIGRGALEIVIFMPFVLPAIIIGESLIIFFREVGLERSLVTVTIGHAAIVLSITYRMVMVKMNSLSMSQIEASRDLGASEIQTFLRVIVPQMKTAIITSGLLAFTISFDETLVSFFLVGSEPTLPIRLLGKMRVGFTPDINALVVVILLITFVFAAIGSLLLRETTKKR